MTFSSQLASYQNARATLQKTKQIVLLYDSAIRFLQQAKLAIEEKRFEERLKLLQKASNIIVGLHNALDFTSGGEIAKVLSNFYSNIDLRIVKLNQTNDTAECDALVKEIKEMRESWAQIDEQVSSKAEAAPPKPSSSDEGSSFEA